MLNQLSPSFPAIRFKAVVDSSSGGASSPVLVERWIRSMVTLPTGVTTEARNYPQNDIFIKGAETPESKWNTLQAIEQVFQDDLEITVRGVPLRFETVKESETKAQ